MLTRLSLWKRLGSNALANVTTGGMVALSQLAMTAIAARLFAPELFATWTVLLSLAALTPLFSANLAAVVTRTLVTNEHDRGQAPEILRAAVLLSRKLGVLALVCIAVILVFIRPWSVPLQQMEAGALAATALGLILAQLWQIGLQPAIGWHYARERAWTVTIGTTGIRLAGLGGLLAAWALQIGEPAVAALMMCVAAWVAVIVVWRLGFSAPTRSPLDPGAVQAHAKQLRVLATAFAVWSAGSAAIQYGLPAIMSILAGGRYNAFFLAYTLNLVTLGVLGSIATSLMAPAARMVSRGGHATIVRVLSIAPLLTALLVLPMLLLVEASTPMLVRWLAPGVATPADVAHYIGLLGFQAIARNLALIFSVILSAAGSPKQVALPTGMEIAAVLVIALPAGAWLGGDAFLVALAMAGVLAALSVALLTMQAVGMARRQMMGLLAQFMLVEALALSIWAAVGHGSV